MRFGRKSRPKKIAQIQGQDLCKAFLSRVVSEEIPPGHLLLHGPSGTGKTSIAFAFCNEYYKKDELYNHVLLVKASDSRGIDEIRCVPVVSQIASHNV